MRRIFYIPALVLLYLLTTAKSCDRQEQYDESVDQSRVKQSLDSIRSAFESDTLAGASLQAFEASAKIKLADFSDYLAILSDPSVAGAFREQAGKMVRGLFISENSVLRFENPGREGKITVSVRQLLTPGREAADMPGKIITDSIRVIRPLQREGTSMYAGLLGYSFSFAGEKPGTDLRRTLAGGTVDYLVIRHEKKFGADSLVIWEVFLGNNE
jgi:hypothetical protein